MSASYHFKQGWDREKLAEYILSKFSFVAKPSTVSDDLGGDFYCTLFRLDRRGKRDYPMPLSSFAIQIKSNQKPADFSRNITYLKNLEIPFLWGVIDENHKRLTVFSGENLPVFISHVGEVRKLTIKTVQRHQMKHPYEPNSSENKSYTVMFPEICQVEINSTGEILGVIVDEIQRVCSLIHGRISTNKSKEYIFDSYDGRSVTILAGPGSVQQYRNNFVKRLAENFYNLKFKYDNLQLPQVSAIEAKMEIIEEFKIYENTYIEIRKLYLQTDFFPVLDAIYNELKAALFDGDNPSKPIRPQS